MSTSASELWAEMWAAVELRKYPRKSTDTTTPTRDLTLEARPNCQFFATDVVANIPGQRPTDVRWAVANVLHFFADTERAAPLARYNTRAELFAPGGRWEGAYGFIAMDQIRYCADLLSSNIHSRRAFVSMGEARPTNINKPACWNHLQFLAQDDVLYMHVYQRSLNLWGVMPYDCVVLTNVLNWLRTKLGLRHTAFQWTVGSLHVKEQDLHKPRAWEHAESCLLPVDVLSDAKECWQWLCHPESAAPPWSEVLLGGLTT